jgi:DNA-binding beta-propeller fold protein YncE
MPAGASSRNPDAPIPFGACDPTGTFVFVSYAHVDKALAYPELLRIRSLGIRVWYDEGIEPGSEWPEAIAGALHRAAAFVVLITPAAVASKNVRNEVNAALSWGKPFFAVHLAQTKLPPGLELQMGHVQAVLRWQMDEGSYARKLGKALASYAEAGDEAPRVGPPAAAASRAASPVSDQPASALVLPGQWARTLARWRGHSGDVTGLAFSPDSLLLATVGSDKTARLWDPATGKHVRTLKGHSHVVQGVAFSPHGRLLATASHDTTVRLWDSAFSRSLRILTGHTSSVVGVAFSPDGRLLATAGWDGTARLWDPVAGGHLRTLTGHTSYLTSVAFSPDGRLLATAGLDKTARLWDPATGKHLRTLTGHTDYVTGVAFSPDGRLLATASNDKTVRLWDPATGKRRTLTGHDGPVRGVAFSPDGRLLATACNATARLWDPATGEQLRSLAHTDTVEGVAFSPDQRLLVTASSDTALLWG